MLSEHQINIFLLLRRAEAGPVLRKIVEQTWWTRSFLGLRCELAALPPIRQATVEITVKSRDSRSFRGFEDEFDRVAGPDLINVFLRQSMCDAGVETLYAGAAPDGSPAYAQWLVTASDQHLLHAYQPGRYPTLAADEVLVEGLYTFSRFRRTGVTTNGMAELLRIARAAGANVAFTYVAADNAPALRSCANVGFALDHVRENRRRFGLRWSAVRPVDEGARHLWTAATSPRPAA
jgi:L-amino acid N-acyltransferase YncA